MRPVFLPVPDPPDQGNRVTPARLRPVLMQLIQLDRLPHAPGWASGPEPSSFLPLPKTLHRVQLDLRIENLDERIQVPLVERPDELADGVVAHGALVALPVTFARK